MPKKVQALDKLLKIDTTVSKKDEHFAEGTFLEFVEKLVILDVLIEPYIFQNFVEYEAFPYDPQNFLGHETALLNVFTFWKHYQQKYVKKLSEATVEEKEYDQWMKKEGQVFKGKEEVEAEGGDKFAMPDLSKMI